MTPSGFPILLIHADKRLSRTVEDALVHAGFNNPLLSFEEGSEAVAYLSGEGAFADRHRHTLPGLILYDLKLRGKTGFEVLEWLKTRPTLRPVPVIVLASSAHGPDIDLAYELGASSFLVKPLDPAEFLPVVEAIANYWLILNQGTA